jgi:hypothetical protein
MLLIKEGRFYCKGVSFTLPEGFLLNTRPDIEYEDGFMLESADHSFELMIQVDTRDTHSKQFMDDLMSQNSFSILRSIAPAELNGMAGHDVFYSTSREQYYEAQYDLRDTEEGIVCMAVLIRVTVKGFTAEDALHTPAVQACLSEVRMEPEMPEVE